MNSNRIWIPNTLTAGSLACGFTAIILGMNPHTFWVAIVLIFCSAFLDMVDGRVARWLGVSSEFGMELDSLADLVAFGVAPAFLMYQFSLHHLGWWGAVAAVAFVVCGGLRLARFNVLTLHKEVPCTVFIGFPIPPAAVLVATLILMELHRGITVDPTWHWVILAGLALLMVSTVPFPSFKRGLHGPEHRLVTIVLVGVVAVLFAFLQEEALLISLGAYITVGLLNSGVQAFFDLQEWLWGFSSLPRIETTIDEGFTWR